jgi:hypothetical protein
MIYNRFSDYLKNKYGSKVYKLPVNLCTACPNRSGMGRQTKDVVNGDIVNTDTELPARSATDSAVRLAAGLAAGPAAVSAARLAAGPSADSAARLAAGPSADSAAGLAAGPSADSAARPFDESAGGTAYRKKGCIFCGDEGADFELLSPEMTITEQLESNRRYIGEKYKAGKYIAYFQNYSNTYLPLEVFKKAMREACADDVVALYISTRPDCIDDARVGFLNQLKQEKGVDVVVELGLQSVNPATLRWLKRGHGLAEFVDAVLRLKGSGIEICTHMINDLPTDDVADVIEGAKFLSALQIDQVKCHSLYVLENTELGDLYRNGDFKPLDMDEFIERTILFLEYLNPEIVVQRLIGRAPAERTLFCSWNTSWRKIQDIIVEKMQAEGRYQGRHFNYLNGSALRGLDN